LNISLGNNGQSTEFLNQFLRGIAYLMIIVASWIYHLIHNLLSLEWQSIGLLRRIKIYLMSLNRFGRTNHLRVCMLWRERVLWLGRIHLNLVNLFI